ncbi:hypothetical protein ACFLZW_07680 [Chloroflexota bacterium]
MNTSYILADTWYDDYGRGITQSVPYTGTATLSGTRDPNAKHSTTVYDDMRRTYSVTAPDSAQVLYDYDDLLTSVTDANGNNTRTRIRYKQATGFIGLLFWINLKTATLWLRPSLAGRAILGEVFC